MRLGWIAAFGVTAGLLFSGCSATQAVFGISGDDTVYYLLKDGVKLVKPGVYDYKRDKAYVVFVNSFWSYKVIDDEHMKFAGARNNKHGTYMVEVNPGKTTFAATANCSDFTATVDAKPGYIYYIRKIPAPKPSLMSYCGGQSRFVIDAYLANESKKANGEVQVVDPAQSDKEDEYNYITIKENIDKADPYIKDSLTLERYKDFAHDDDEDLKYLKLQVPSDAGVKIPERYFKN